MKDNLFRIGGARLFREIQPGQRIRTLFFNTIMDGVVESRTTESVFINWSNGLSGEHLASSYLWLCPIALT